MTASVLGEVGGMADACRIAMDAKRKTQRARRQERQGGANVVLVGYTNTGKSTRMRALTGCDVLEERADIEGTFLRIRGGSATVKGLCEQFGHISRRR